MANIFILKLIILPKVPNKKNQIFREFIQRIDEDTEGPLDDESVEADIG